MSLRRWFVPHAQNGYYPRFWRRGPLLAVLSIALLAGAFRYAVPILFKEGSFLAAILPTAIVTLTNEERAENGVGELSESPLLAEAARLKAEDMAARGYFAHVSPEGWEPWKWLDQVGYGYSHAGENLAVNFDDSEDVVRAWMRSPTHRANIVKGKYAEIGIGLAKGRFNGRSAIYVVQYFGTPKAGVAAARPMAKPAPAAAAPSVAATVAGASVGDVPAPVIELAASPRGLSTYILWALLVIVAASFATAVFVAVRIQHRAIIVAGGLLIAGIGWYLWLGYREPAAERLLGGQPATSTVETGAR